MKERDRKESTCMFVDKERTGNPRRGKKKKKNMEGVRTDWDSISHCGEEWMRGDKEETGKGKKGGAG